MASLARNNLAYDLSRFESGASQAKEQVQARPEIKKVAKTKPAAHISTVKAVACMLLVVAVASALLYTRVQLTESIQAVADATETYAELEAEGTRMNLELESKVSLKNAEEYATQTLGMTKMDGKSVEYLRLTQDDKIEVPNEGGTDFWSSVKNFFANLLS